MSIVCALSKKVPKVPVVSQVSGYIFDRQLIEKYIKEHGTDPINGQKLTVQQLTDLKFSTEKSPGFAVPKSPTKSPRNARNVSPIHKSPTKSPSSAHNDSIKSTDSCSSLTVDKVNNIVGVDYKQLLGERKQTAEEVLEHIERAPSNVLDEVFKTLARSERTHRYPNDQTLEITRSAMFHPILEIVVDELMLQLNLTSSDDIEIQGEVKISLPQPGKDVRGRIDYIVNKPTDTTVNKPTDTTVNKPTDTTVNKPTDTTVNKPTDTTVNESTFTTVNESTFTTVNETTDTTEVECNADPGVPNVVKSKDRVFLHVECKKCDPVHGYKQILLFLKDARDKHLGLEEIFAISTTFDEWMLVKSSGEGQFMATKNIPMLFEGMGNRENEKANKETWLEKYSKIVDVIWTILKKELQNSPRRMLAQTEQPTGKQSSGSNTQGSEPSDSKPRSGKPSDSNLRSGKPSGSNPRGGKSSGPNTRSKSGKSGRKSSNQSK